jgi:hypothetical protein
VADSITAGQIAAGAIGTEQLAAQIVLASEILTAVEGARIELDDQGIRVYSATENLLFNAPTDGSDLYVNAEIAALGLSVSGDAVFQGDGNSLAIGAVLTAEASVVKPTQAPTLAQGWDSVTLPINSTYDLSSTKYTRQGLAYDPAGGADGATKVFYQIAEQADGQMVLLELLASDRTVNRTHLFAGADSLSLYRPSIVRHSDWVYVYYSDWNTGRHVVRLLQSDLSEVDFFHSVSLPGDGARPWDHQITSDGTNPYIVGVDEFGTIKWNKYNDTMVKQGSTVNTGHVPNGLSTNPVGAFAGSADLGAFRILFYSEFGTVYVYNSSGTRQSNEEFAVAGPNQSPGPSCGLTYGDALGDGARFWSLGAIQNSTAQTICKHSTWTWTTASSKYWVAYSWYDDVGTAHETEVGPRASITMGRRKKLTITAAALPGTGGVDDPNKRRVYVVPKSTSPATTELKLQNAFADMSTVLRSYDSGGDAPQTTNGFAGLGSPAEIKSATSGWSLKGDGTSSFGRVTATDVRLSAGADASLSSTTHAFQIGSDGGTNLIIDENEIMARNNGAAADLLLNRDGGNVLLGASGSRLSIEGGLTLIGTGVASGSVITITGGIEFDEITTPGAPGANKARLYVDDNGSGKSRLRIRFATGAVQTISTEP